MLAFARQGITGNTNAGYPGPRIQCLRIKPATKASPADPMPPADPRPVNIPAYTAVTFSTYRTRLNDVRISCLANITYLTLESHTLFCIACAYQRQQIADEQWRSISPQLITHPCHACGQHPRQQQTHLLRQPAAALF